MDWDSDPELKKIKQEFIESMGERRTVIARSLTALKERNWDEVNELRLVAHKLAGSAQSYGFPTLTQVGEKLDDYLTYFIDCEKDKGNFPDIEKITQFFKFFAEMIEFAETGKDPEHFMSEQRAKDLTSFYESLPSEAKSESF